MDESQARIPGRDDGVEPGNEPLVAAGEATRISPSAGTNGPAGGAGGLEPRLRGDAASAVRPAPRSILGTVLWVLVVLICCAGLVVTKALSEGHRHAGHTEGLLSAACSPTLGENVSCDQVLQSRWAYQWVPARYAVLKQWVQDRIASFRGATPPIRGNEGWGKLPAAWLGMAYFAAMATWFLFVGQPSYSRRALHVIPLLVVSAGLIGSLCFMYLLLFRLPAMCPLCMMTHGINFLLFLGVVLLWPKRPPEAPGVVYAPRPSWKQVVTTAVLVWFVVQVVIMGQSAGQAGADVAAYQARLREYDSNPIVQFELAADKLLRETKYEIPVDDDDPILGPKDARRTLVLFSDFQCPACRLLHDRLVEMWPDLQRAAAPVGGIRLIYKHYPLYTPCNARANTNMHAYSCDAAKAVEAARIVGGPDAFWKMAALLYRNYQDLDLAPYARLAKESGLDVAAFERARRSPEAAERVARHVQEGAAAGMSSTPGLYLDGIRVTEFGTSGPSIWAFILRLPDWPPTDNVLNMLPAVRRLTTSAPAQPTRPGVPASAKTR